MQGRAGEQKIILSGLSLGPLSGLVFLLTGLYQGEDVVSSLQKTLNCLLVFTALSLLTSFIMGVNRKKHNGKQGWENQNCRAGTQKQGNG